MLEIVYLGVNMFGDVNFFVFIYDDKIDFVEWLVEYGWVVDFVCSIFEL